MRLRLFSLKLFLMMLSTATAQEQSIRTIVSTYNNEVQVANDVYSDTTRLVPDTDGVKRTRNWEDIINSSNRSPEMKKFLIDAGRKDGFYAAEYEINGRKLIAFRGTTDSTDWQVNANQIMGAKTTQYDLIAKALSEDISKMENVSCVGHSLGGGLANYSCGLVGKPSLTVNAATLSKDHLDQIKDKSKITNIFVGDDIVHKLGNNQPGKNFHIITSEKNGAVYNSSDFTLKDIGRATIDGLKNTKKMSFGSISPLGGFVRGASGSALDSAVLGPHSAKAASDIFSAWNKVINDEQRTAAAGDGAKSPVASTTQPNSVAVRSSTTYSPNIITRIEQGIAQPVSATVPKPSFSDPKPVVGQVNLSSGSKASAVATVRTPSALGVPTTWEPSTLSPAQLDAASNKGIRTALTTLHVTGPTKAAPVVVPVENKSTNAAGLPLQQSSSQWIQKNGLNAAASTSGTATPIRPTAPTASSALSGPSRPSAVPTAAGLPMQQTTDQWLQKNGMASPQPPTQQAHNQVTVKGHSLGGALNKNTGASIDIKRQPPSAPVAVRQTSTTASTQRGVASSTRQVRVASRPTIQSSRPSYSAQQRQYQAQQRYAAQQQRAYQQQMRAQQFQNGMQQLNTVFQILGNIAETGLQLQQAAPRSPRVQSFCAQLPMNRIIAISPDQRDCMYR